MILFSNFIYNKTFVIYFFRKSILFFFVFPNIKLVFRFFSLCFLKKSDNFLSFVFTSKSIFSGFLKKLLNSFNSLSYIFFFKLYLKGLGYRVRRISRNLYKFFFIYTNFFYLHLPQSVFLKIKRRRLVFFGFDLSILRTVLVNLLLLNKMFVYTIRGFLFPRQIIFLKPGKKRI